MRRLYTLLIRCAAPFAFATVLWRGLRDRGYWQGLGERFGWGGAAASKGSIGSMDSTDSTGTIWLHAVSLGEMSAAAPLVRALRSRYPKIPMTVTTATPTGRARARTLFGDTVSVRFLPYDTPGAVKRFLARVRPRLAIIVETELWPNLFGACERMGVPLVLASARLSAKSVSRYRRMGRLFPDIFSASSLVAAQTREDAERFIAIGAQSARTRVVGNIKFDIEIGAGVWERGRALRVAFGSERPTWIAGSTHAGEEEQVLAAHVLLQADVPNALLLLVPRHPDRFAAVAELLQRRGLKFARRSSGIADSADGDAACGGSGGTSGGTSGGASGGASGAQAIIGADIQVVLVDTVGELATMYAAADVAFVGGSLVPVGGHNLLEPAALGLALLTGPYTSNGRDVARLMLSQGAAVQVADAAALAAALRALFADGERRQRMGAIARHIVESNRGSVARLISLIAPLLSGEPSPPAGSLPPGEPPPPVGPLPPGEPPPPEPVPSAARH